MSLFILCIALRGWDVFDVSSPGTSIANCLATGLVKGIPAEKVRAILGEPDTLSPLDYCSSCHVGDRRICIYKKLGVVIVVWTPEMWWAVPTGTPPYWPKNAWVTAVGFNHSWICVPAVPGGQAFSRLYVGE